MSIYLKFVELTADVLEIYFIKHKSIKQKHEQKQKNRTPPIKKKLTHIVYYKYQHCSLQR